MWCLAMWVLFKFALDTVLPLPFADFLADHQGSSQSDHRTQTQVSAPLNSRPVNGYRKGGATPKWSPAQSSS